MNLLKIFRRPAISKEQAMVIAMYDFIAQGWGLYPFLTAHFAFYTRRWYVGFHMPYIEDGTRISAEINADTGEILDSWLFHAPHGEVRHRKPNWNVSILD